MELRNRVRRIAVGPGAEEHHPPRGAVSSAVTTSACAAFPTYRAPRSSPATANPVATTTPNRPARLALDGRRDSCRCLGHPVPRVTRGGCCRCSAAEAYLRSLWAGRTWRPRHPLLEVVSGSRVGGLTHRGPADLLDGRGMNLLPCSRSSHSHPPTPSAATCGWAPTGTAGSRRCRGRARLAPPRERRAEFGDG